MSKNKPGNGAGGNGGGDRKVEGVKGGDSDAPRMIPTVPSGLPTPRPTLATVGHTGHTYIVQPQHHDVKTFPPKLTRPIAPAPPSQVGPASGRNVQVSQPNIISSSLGVSGSNEGLASLNLVASSTSTHNSLSVPVTLTQANVLQLGSAVSAGPPPVTGCTGPVSTVVPQGLAGSIPINMLRGAGNNPTTGGTQPVQAFAPSNFSAHIPRGTTTTLSVPKSGAMLRQGGNLQIPAPSAVNLPLARQPILQGVRTTTPSQVSTRSPSPSVAPQDLSRTNFPLHGSITSATSGLSGGPHPMQITLNRPVAQEGTTTLQGRISTGPLAADQGPGSGLPQRISVSDGGIHSRIAADLGSRPGITLAQPKVNTQVIGPQAKIITSQPLGQHVAATLKSVNLAVSTPVMINSVNPALSTATTTIASTAPIPIAKVTPQRQLPTSNLPTTLSTQLSVSAAGAVLPPPSSLGHSAGTVTALIQSSLPNTPSVAAATTSTPTLVPTSAAQSSNEVSGPGRPDLGGTGPPAGQGQQGGIIISQDFQARPPGSIITMTTLAASVQGGVAPAVISHAENRTCAGPSDSMWYQHFMYPQQGTASAMVRPGTSTFAFLPQGNKFQPATSNMAATQLAQAVAASNVRYNTMVMQQQPQQQLPLHSTFNTGSTTTITGDKLVSNLSSRATVASSIYTASVGVQSSVAGGGVGAVNSSGLSSVPLSNPSSSPRPSILRKRPSEATGVVIRKPNFNLSQVESRCHSPPRVDTVSSSVSSPKISVKNYSPMSENSQSSTDTALSSNDATTPTHNHNDKGKGDGEDHVENGPSSVSVLNNIPASPAVSHSGNASEASPRKRARKQLLHANEELKDNVSSSEDETMHTNTVKMSSDLTKDHHHISKLPMHHGKEPKEEFTDDDGVRWVLNKPKPNFVLIQPECINNKTKHNHFVRYTDVKPKDERHPTVNELSNQRGITQKVNGWKLYFTASQLEELMDVEKDMEVQFAEVQAALAKIPAHKFAHDESGKLHEMSQANIQRCQLIQNQLTEARASMIRTLDHKPRIQEIVNKHMSKRPIKKKERT